MLKKEFHIDINYEVFWKDIQVVLDCISSKAFRFKTFVADPFQIILTKEKQQHHDIPESPRKNASRGLDLRKADEIHRWFASSEFLYSAEEGFLKRTCSEPVAKG